MLKKDNMKIEPGNIIFHCSTAVLDEIIITGQGKEFNRQMADDMDSDGKGFSFVVDYEFNYRVVPTKMVKDAGLPSGCLQTDKITATMQHYIDSLGLNKK